jgi:integrase
MPSTDGFATGSARRRSGRARRANGEGTIYRRKDGRYEARVYVLTTAGVEKRITRYGRTYEEAHRKLVELQAQHHQGVPVSVSELLVGDYLEQWLSGVVSRKRPKTYVGYRDVVRLHITPVIGKKRLTKLTTQDVRRLVAHTEQKCICCVQGLDARREPGERRCCAIGECCGRRLSQRMVQLVHAVLRAALQDAMREELVPRNVAKLVQVDAPDNRPGRGLAAAEAYRVLQAAEAEPLHALYVLALYLGLRRAELLGLHWEDVRLRSEPGRYPYLEITKTLQRVGGELRFVPPKTRTSRRTIPLPPVCVSALQQHAERQEKQRAAGGPDWKEHGLVFPSRVGTPMEPDNLRRSWDRIKTAAGVQLRFHDLRHTCVTLLLEIGTPPHIVREIAGHSALDVTMTIYAHTSLEEKYRALSRLDERLGEESLSSGCRQTGDETGSC